MDRDEFMELVYETFADEPDNVLANGIIEAADAYVEHEKAQLSKEGATKGTTSELPTIQPEPHYDEWCTGCKEYDQKRHNCPRWNKVIRQTLKDIEQKEGHWIDKGD